MRRVRGGQTIDPALRKRHNLTFRVRDSLKQQLEQAAQENDWTLSREIEFRLEQSFLGVEVRATQSETSAQNIADAILFSIQKKLSSLF